MIRVFGRNRLNRYQASKLLAMDGKTGSQIILIITGLRPALWPSIAEQIQLWRLVSVLYHSYPGLCLEIKWRQQKSDCHEYWCL